MASIPRTGTDDPPATRASSANSVIVRRASDLHASSVASELRTPPLQPHRPEVGESNVDLTSGGRLLGEEADEAWRTEDNITSLRFISHNDRDASPPFLDDGPRSPPLKPPTPGCPPGGGLTLPADKSRKPFHKWMNTLRKRGEQRRRDGEVDTTPTHFLSIDAEVTKPENYHRHRRHSSSDSSFAFITALKSPSISLASFSVLGRSKLATTVLSPKAQSRTDRSSRASLSGVRLSEDSQYPSKHAPIDPAVTERAMQRRRILEELISTEEGYIRDVRFLMNVYVTILASLPTHIPGLRSSINLNMTEIVELHEELLGELHRAVPRSEYTQAELPARAPEAGNGLSSVPEDKDGMSCIQNVPGIMAEPQVVAEVAKIFTAKMNRFFVYEEYGAKYELMMKDVTLARRTLADWEKYQKGLEALAASIGPINCQDDFSTKKSLTVGDLLVKPIQRVCKYPLLFAELLKYTPVVDCPHSHIAIEDALGRLREATGQINRATDDPHIKSTLQRTWLLQDRLVFPEPRLDVTWKNRIRSFANIHLCGVLHVCWQTKETVTGQYLICLLYRDWLCIATAGKTEQTYTILLCIGIANLKVEDADNGKGIQCHTAPYSWKLVFECACELYEIIMTACSPRECHEWRSRLEQSASSRASHSTNPLSFCAPSLKIRSLGTVFGKPGTIARRISIHRATTVGPKYSLSQVILKNMSAEKEVVTPPSSSAAPTHRPQRSQSLLGPASRVSVLAPPRTERIRLEGLLSDVWTREILPFPGMTARGRSEHLVRSGASSMIRKLSVASIASTFSRRSASATSISKTATLDCLGSASARATTDPSGLVGAGVAIDERRGSWPVMMDAKSVATMPPSDSHHDVDTDSHGLSSALSFSDTAVDRIRPADFAVQRQPASPVLGASAKSSVQLSRLPSTLSKPSRRDSILCEFGKGDSYQARLPRGSAGYKPSAIKTGSRWTKVGGLHRGVMVQGIRGFFQ